MNTTFISIMAGKYFIDESILMEDILNSGKEKEILADESSLENFIIENY